MSVIDDSSYSAEEVSSGAVVSSGAALCAVSSVTDSVSVAEDEGAVSEFTEETASVDSAGLSDSIAEDPDGSVLHAHRSMPDTTAKAVRVTNRLFLFLLFTYYP